VVALLVAVPGVATMTKNVRKATLMKSSLAVRRGVPTQEEAEARAVVTLSRNPRWLSGRAGQALLGSGDRPAGGSAIGKPFRGPFAYRDEPAAAPRLRPSTCLGF